MTTAVLYIRVSTDEQALKGYSQRSQEDRLRKFCIANKIEVLEVVFEDHSAKSFQRPAWSKLMQAFHQKKTNRPTLLLFTRWDRFSRNTADAYYTISQLQRLCIEPQAIDQPLDMAIPENKVLLAMYIVTAEVENDRRSLNVKYGIYKAKQEGRYMGHAPLGFINAFTENGKKIIIPHEPEATLLKKVFNTIVEGCSIRLLHKQSIQMGLRCSLSAFYNIIHNPVYCGRIRIPIFEGKPAYEVQGVHEPLITEALFEQVQMNLHKRVTPYLDQSSNDLLFLRGFLFCPKCLKRLSGSGSQGHSKKYYYYHCSAKCGYRIRADQINDWFIEGFQQLTAHTDYLNLFQHIVKSSYQELFQQQQIDQAYINRTFEKLTDRVVRGKELLLRGDIDESDYLVIKSDCEQRINVLGQELNDTYLLGLKQEDKCKTIVAQLTTPYLLFNQVDLLSKRKIIHLLLK